MKPALNVIFNFGSGGRYTAWCGGRSATPWREQGSDFVGARTINIFFPAAASAVLPGLAAVPALQVLRSGTGVDVSGGTCVGALPRPGPTQTKPNRIRKDRFNSNQIQFGKYPTVGGSGRFGTGVLAYLSPYIGPRIMHGIVLKGVLLSPNNPAVSRSPSHPCFPISAALKTAPPPLPSTQDRCPFPPSCIQDTPIDRYWCPAHELGLVRRPAPQKYDLNAREYPECTKITTHVFRDVTYSVNCE